ELITVCAASMPPAPVRSSMTNGTPRYSANHAPMIRAPMSFGPPAAKPTTKVTGRLGHVWANADLPTNPVASVDIPVSCKKLGPLNISMPPNKGHVLYHQTIASNRLRKNDEIGSP